MAARPETLDTLLARADSLLAAASKPLHDGIKATIERWRADAAATRFHLSARASAEPVLLAVIGGTGTGKSTLVNRILGQSVTATSFRRTYTSGAIAVVRRPADLPDGWLGIPHVPAPASSGPARGQPGALLWVEQQPADAGQASAGHAVLIDTPDMDGDQPAHHAEADRVFRWAQGILFLVTPEKYQMTELLPYYRLASRYGLPVLFCMNKCEEQAAVDDFQLQLAGRRKQDGTTNQANSAGPIVYAIPRDDAGYEAPADLGLTALRGAIASIRPSPSQAGLASRGTDLVGRLVDQIVGPLRSRRRDVDRLIAALRAMEAPDPGVDVNSVTQDLRRRLQQRSVLYLMGPQRMLDRVRQAPSLLARLPRAAWEYVRTGEVSMSLNPSEDGRSRDVPDFAALLRDQFAQLQSRIDDLLRENPTSGAWIRGNDEDSARLSGEPRTEGVVANASPSEQLSDYKAALLPPERAGEIAEEELAELRSWLQKRWNATPRDTRLLMALLRYLPGGQKLTQWSEAAPYLLTLVVVTHHAFFGHVDLMVLGGYTLATWLSERLSNEVASHTRAANQRIADRFGRLAHEQIQQVIAWLQSQCPTSERLDQLDALAARWDPDAR